MLITIVILGAAAITAVAYFAAWIFPAGVEPRVRTRRRKEGGHRGHPGASPDATRRPAPYLRGMPSKEES